MRNSQRVAFWEAMYDRINTDLFSGKAPRSVTLTVAIPSKKKSGKSLTVGLWSSNCMDAHGCGPGAEHIITLHPLQGDDLVAQGATLLHEMIHHMLPPEVKHGKLFKKQAESVGLVAPWTATTADDALARQLAVMLDAVEADLGYRPVGHYVPSLPPDKKPTANRKVACACTEPQRLLSVTQGKLDQGAIICGVCKREFLVVEGDEPMKE